MTTEPLSVPDPNDASRAFDELVQAHYGRLCNFAYRFVRSREVAEDIVQDVFAQLWCRRTEFTVREPLPYLYQAVRNRAVNDQRQRNVRERSRDQVAAEVTDRAASAGVAAELETNDLTAALARAVDDLPDRCRLVFTMSREQDLSYAEIASALGISIKTVETQMTRALRTLRTRLAGYLGVALAVFSALK